MHPYETNYDTILNLSKTASADKQEPIGEEFMSTSLLAQQEYITQLSFLMMSQYWGLPMTPPQNQYVPALDLSPTIKTEETLNMTNYDCVSPYRSDSGGTISSSKREPTLRKRRVSNNQNILKDDAYLKLRKKNNLAAKKCREMKHKHDVEIRAQLIILQDENQRLKNIVNRWKNYASQCCCPADAQLLCEMFESMADEGTLGEKR